VSLVGSWGGVRLLGCRVRRLLGRAAHVLRGSAFDGAAVPRVAALTDYDEGADGSNHGSDADDADDGAHRGESLLILGLIRCGVVVSGCLGGQLDPTERRLAVSRLGISILRPLVEADDPLLGHCKIASTTRQSSRVVA
jgi:hypothetical protein